jgi:uncharacterized SAM-binding protein YcdF (DUF218 family)
VAGLLGWIALRLAYPFLAVNDPRPGGVLVIEAWMPDDCLQQAIAEFHRHHYDKVFVTGGPIDKGGPLSEYKTLPDLAAAVLFKLGMNSNDVVIVPAAAVIKDRTYASAKAMERWWHAHQMPVTRVNLISVGPHARRSRLMFEKALGDGVTVGVVALAPRAFDPRRWWHSSEGFRTVTSEIIAYAYARVLFRRPEAEALNQ